jgi:hypothetical protein
MLELLKNFALPIGVPPYRISFPQETSRVLGVAHCPGVPPSFSFVLYMPSQLTPLSNAVLSATAQLKKEVIRAINSDEEIRQSTFNELLRKKSIARDPTCPDGTN